MKSIASVSVYDPKAPEEHQYSRIGTIWWDEATQRCSILFKAIAQGHLVGRAFDNNQNPFLQGDIVLACGTYKNKAGEEKTEYVNLGFVTTSENGVYSVVIRAIPLYFQIKGGANEAYRVDGLWASVVLDEHKTGTSAAKGSDDDEKLPF